MIKEVYQKCVVDGTTPGSLSREEFLALIVLRYWAGFIDPQNMIYYMGCTTENISDESRLSSIIRTANRYVDKYCNSKFKFDEDTDKELILKYTDEYEDFYFTECEKEHAEDNKESNSETV